MQRVFTYIDGFNLYFGLKSSGYQRYYWLNVQAMARRLLQPDQRLDFTKYFTARIVDPPDKRRRQSIYLEALQTVTELDLYFGTYLSSPRTCRRCGDISYVSNEKMTDVNIAVELLADAFADRFDTAILVSADSDLRAPLQKIRQLFPQKRIVVAFPPNRQSFELRSTAHAYLTIGRAVLAKSQFPVEIVKADGYTLRCPSSWR